jgi:channel protein (hemolysin III family)
MALEGATRKDLVADCPHDAIYHRVRSSSASVRVWLRRLDHSAIFVFIAGTYTPFVLLAFRGALATTLLAVVWTAAAAGLLLSIAWVDAPAWLATVVYVGLGWVGVVALPELSRASVLRSPCSCLLAGASTLSAHSLTCSAGLIPRPPSSATTRSSTSS